MVLIRGKHNLKQFNDSSIVTIGSFDGVHVGHQEIIKQLLSVARQMNLPAVAVIFEPQPQEYFQGGNAPARLTYFREKYQALIGLGVDRVCCLPFNASIQSLTACEFIDQILVAGLQVKHLVVGDDFRFGCDRKGDYTLLKQESLLRGFSVENTRTIKVDGERVSSSRLRQALASEQYTLVRRLLGRSYMMAGRVVYGRQLGRQLGVPTANIVLRYPSPLRGVYAVLIQVSNRVYQGIANIGNRPTVDGKRFYLEVHLFDFSGSLYGQRIAVEFLSRIRREMKFTSIELLKKRIEQDVQQVKEWFREKTIVQENEH